MNITDMYSVGDFVVSTCENCNGAVHNGDIGVVAKIEPDMILVDWHVKPDPGRMHSGNRVDFELPTCTGWWVYDYRKQDIEPLDDGFTGPVGADLDALFA